MGLAAAGRFFVLVTRAILILAFVVIVIGGIGSIRGPGGALLVGVGTRPAASLLPALLRQVLAPEAASSVGSISRPADLCADGGGGAVLQARRGLFPARG